MALKNTPPIINGVAYTHSDLKLLIDGAAFIEILSVEYSSPQEITKNFTTGHRATSVGFGQVDDAASLTISLTDFQRLVANSPGGDIQNYPFFDISVSYLPEENTPVRHRLIACKFKGPDMSSEPGNSIIEVTLELHVSKINYRA